MTERVLYRVQAAEMRFLRRVHGVAVTLRDKVPSCEIRRALNVEPFPRIERSQLRYSSAMCPECPTKDWRGKSCWL